MAGARISDPLSSVIGGISTPQTTRAREDQVANNAGGFVFSVSLESRVRRFLILGVEGGTYYQSAPELARENAKSVIEMAERPDNSLVREILEVSLNGLAARQNPTMFALAIASSLGSDECRKAAFDAIPRVCRTGTHLFLFIRYMRQFRGWGRGIRRGVGAWHNDKDVAKLAYQAAKYRQREGWTHRDVLRQAHPKTDDPARKNLYDWICGRSADLGRDEMKVIAAYEAAKTANSRELVSLIKHNDLSWEMLPDTAMNDPKVWEALLGKGMPMTALIRQLGRLTRLEVLGPKNSKLTASVVAQLQNKEELQRSRVHPFTILLALTTYQSGASYRGSDHWIPVRSIVDALDAAFYLAFSNIAPSGKRIMLSLDVSGSMASPILNSRLSAREGSAAMAMITAATEPNVVEINGFTSGQRSTRYGWGSYGGSALTPLDISPRRRLDDNVRAISGLSFGGTDCSLPITEALKRDLAVDVFVVYTDSETWAGQIQPFEALQQYRRATGINAKLVVVGMTSSGFTIADPDDAGMLDVVGFDASAPSVISEFAKGNL